jgi:hypothetical protein
MEKYRDRTQRAYNPTGSLYEITDSQITSLLPYYTSFSKIPVTCGVERAFKDIMAVILYQNLSVPVGVFMSDGEITMEWSNQSKEIVIKPLGRNGEAMVWIEGRVIYPYPKQMETDIVSKLLAAAFTRSETIKVYL